MIRRDETMAHNIMFLCFAAAVVLVSVHVWTMTSNSGVRVAFAREMAESTKLRRNKALALPVKTPISLTVDLSDRQVFVYRNSRLIARYPVAIGQPGWETPTGAFRVHSMKRNPAWQHPITRETVPPGQSGNPLGDRWIGFWSGEKTEIGFHGTNQEDLIGQAVSHGCLRMRNHDIRALFEIVIEGTPVTVRP